MNIKRLALSESRQLVDQGILYVEMSGQLLYPRRGACRCSHRNDGQSEQPAQRIQGPETGGAISDRHVEVAHRVDLSGQGAARMAGEDISP